MHKRIKLIEAECGDREMKGQELLRDKGRKSLLYLKQSSFATVEMVRFLIRAIVRQSDLVW